MALTKKGREAKQRRQTARYRKRRRILLTILGSLTVAGALTGGLFSWHPWSHLPPTPVASAPVNQARSSAGNTTPMRGGINEIKVSLEAQRVYGVKIDSQSVPKIAAICSGTAQVQQPANPTIINGKKLTGLATTGTRAGQEYKLDVTCTNAILVLTDATTGRELPSAG